MDTALFRMLALKSRHATIPIWSCRPADSLYAASFIPSFRHCSTVTVTPKIDEPTKKVTIDLDHGLPHVTVPLPSRSEPCIFALRPVTHSVGDFLNMLKLEDPGIDRAVIRTTEGVRIASTTSIQTLLQKEFDLVMNETTYRVEPSEKVLTSTGGFSQDELDRLGDVRALVGQLYEALNVEEHQVAQEHRLVKELEMLKDELAPLEERRKFLAEQAERRTNNLTWVGLGLMSVQFGILARLTWWEYSWDIMEPVTYFVTYGTAIACYAYFVLTKQDYLLPDVRDRQFLFTFHRRARKSEWDVSKYNSLRDGIARIELDLRRLRDPLRVRSVTEGVGSIIGNQIHIGNIREILKSKFST